MTTAYKKHYPKGPAAPRLVVVLRRAGSRYSRWRRQAARRRPELVRVLTPAERTVRQLRGFSQELNELLAPFRLTRPRGHEDLRGLLADADTGPALVAQVLALQACLDRLAPVQTLHGQQVNAWRQEWDRASEARRHELRHVCKAITINGWLKGLTMLSEEARQDIYYIRLMAPDAFTATVTTPQPASVGPTPYSS